MTGEGIIRYRQRLVIMDMQKAREQSDLGRDHGQVEGERIIRQRSWAGSRQMSSQVQVELVGRQQMRELSGLGRGHGQVEGERIVRSRQRSWAGSRQNNS